MIMLLHFLKVTGADLREWLEMSAGQFNQIDPNNKAPQNIKYRISYL